MVYLDFKSNSLIYKISCNSLHKRLRLSMPSLSYIALPLSAALIIYFAGWSKITKDSSSLVYALHNYVKISLLLMCVKDSQLMIQ